MTGTSLHISHVARICALALTVTPGWCDPPIKDEYPSRCSPEYTYDDGGCAEIRGIVLDVAGQPMRHVQVRPRIVDAAPEHYRTSARATNDDGRFAVGIERWAPSDTMQELDTLAVWLRASTFDLRTGTFGKALDSVLVDIEIGLAGTIVHPAEVQIRLAAP